MAARFPGAGLYIERASRLHRLAPHCKIASALLFVLAVVSTPREAFWAFGAYAVLLAGVARVGRIPALTIIGRLVVEVPFLAFALMLPLVGRGPRVRVLGVSLSEQGLWGAWNILGKGTLGVATTVLLASSTTVSEILHGLEHLRMPAMLVTITSFMVRYGTVISTELARMRVARASRGHNPRWIWQARAVAASAGALFIRSYERGERVYLAMASRGYSATMPLTTSHSAGPRDWATALSLPLAGAVVTAAAWVRG